MDKGRISNPTENRVQIPGSATPSLSTIFTEMSGHQISKQRRTAPNIIAYRTNKKSRAKNERRKENRKKIIKRKHQISDNI